MTIDRFLAIIAIIVSSIAVPASGYLSYRYAVKGEKRKEINAVVDPIRNELVTQIDAMRNGGYYLTNVQRKNILHYIDISNSNVSESIIGAFERFELEHSHEKLCQQGPGRRVVIGDTSEAIKASEELLNLIKRV